MINIDTHAIGNSTDIMTQGLMRNNIFNLEETCKPIIHQCEVALNNQPLKEIQLIWFSTLLLVFFLYIKKNPLKIKDDSWQKIRTILIKTAIIINMTMIIKSII